MSIFRFPSIIRDLSENLMPETTPPHAVRLSGDLNGSSGESYILAYHDKTCLFTRSMGESEYRHFFVNHGDIIHPHVEEKRYDELLKFTIEDHHYSLKFPRYDRADVDALIHYWNASAKANPHDKKAKEHPPSAKHNSAVGFLALLIHAATIDGELDDREETYIENLCANDQDALKHALALYKGRSLDDLLDAVDGYDTAQKLCLITNLIEVVMSDGILDSSEQVLVSTICERFGVDDALFTQINDVLMVKNQTSVVGL